MANDLTTTTDRAVAAFSAQTLTQSMRTVLDRAFEVAAVFTAPDIALITPIAEAAAVPQVADERTIRQSLGALAAALPAQDVGDAGGKLKLNAYQSMLAGCDHRALSYACRRCLDELDWMPTVHQLKERLRGWVSPEVVAIGRAKAILRAGKRLLEAGGSAPVDAREAERLNAFLRAKGIRTQFNDDGTTFQLAEAEAAAA